MNTKFTIKNFRVFDENGVTVDVKPLTILTGCNSSGKSSIIKAACLFNDYIKKTGLNISKYVNFDFTKRPYSLLGDFSRVINDKSLGKTITFQYRVHSLMLGCDVDVEYVFENSDKKDLGNICLKSLKVRDDNNILCQAYDLKDIDSYYDPYFDPQGPFRMIIRINYSVLKQAFIRFAEMQVKMNDLLKYYKKKSNLHAEQYRALKKSFNNQPIEEFKPIYENEEFDKCVSLLEITDDMDAVEKSLIECHKEIVKESSEQAWQDAVKWFRESSPIFSTFIRDEIDGQRRYVMEKVKGKIDNPFCDDNFCSYIEDLKNTDCISYFAQEVVKYNMSADEAYSRLLEYADDEIKQKSDFWAGVKTDMYTHLANESECSYEDILSVFRLSLSTKEVKDVRDKYNRIIDFLKDSYKKSSYENFVDYIKNLENIIINQCSDLNLYLDIDCCFSKDASENEKMIFTYLFCSEYWLYKFKEGHSEKISSLIELFSTFCNIFREEIFIGEMPEPIYYIGSDVVDVKRFYPVENNDIFTNLIKNLYNKKNSYFNDLYPMPVNSLVGKIPTDHFINKWLKEFNICDHYKIELVGEGAGWIIRLYRSKDDKEGSILADYGYGITQLFTLIVSIALAGPLQTIAVEEPEIHLHPSFQSKLAEMFVEAYSIYNAHFIIETHSEYLIRKLQTLVASKKVNSKDISLVYVYDADKENRPLYTPQVQLIVINPDGSLNGDFGTGFFDEADNLSMSLFLKQG